MSMQRVQGVLLFLVRFNNSAQFEIYRVTRSSSSRLFLCALAELNSAILLYIVLALTNIQDSLDRKGLKIVWIPLPSVCLGKMDNMIRVYQ